MHPTQGIKPGRGEGGAEGNILLVSPSSETNFGFKRTAICDSLAANMCPLLHHNHGGHEKSANPQASHMSP